MSSTSPKLKRESAVKSAESRSSSRIIGAGEMADIIRGFAWDASPLGPIETWSDTLVTTVNLLLASRHPIFLWWGADLIQFYNDGYRPSIRADKHPRAVGQCGKECWPEIWDIIGPQIDAVMNQGVSSWNLNQLVPINRNGKLEEVYWTYGYSPVRDEEGCVQGTLVVCSETTEQVLSERRLRSLLSLSGDTPLPDGSTPSEPLVHIAKKIVRKLDENPADIPCAGLYLMADGEILLAEEGPDSDPLTDASRWPLESVIQSHRAVLVEDLQSRFGNVVRGPCPEPITRAYVLPVPIPGLSIQGALVLGVSPRLPFDDNYQTFFELLAARIGALLQSEVHRLELAWAYDQLEKKVTERTAALEAEVSERKRAEMGLRELTGRLLVTQDEERRHMARELHDHAGQTLGLLAMNLSALCKAAPDQESRIAQLAAESRQLSEALSREIRTFSYLLHPPLLDEAGLRSALQWYIDGFAERSKIKVDLEVSKDMGRLPRDLEMVIFRVVQESLTNIHHHSGSLSASIQLAAANNCIDLEIRDAGKGISPERQRELNTAKSGVGVRGMEERVRQFGGTLEISSSNQGTKVVVHLPLDANLH